MATLANITRYTDPEDYDLTLVDCDKKWAIRDEYGVLKIDKTIEVDKSVKYPEAMNIGAAQSDGEYICFIENDIFVWENWLNDLLWYIENDVLDAVMPHQIPTTRARQLEFNNMTHQEALNQGNYEAGLIIMRRSDFEKIGHWDGDKNIICWKDFFSRIDDASLRRGHTAKVTISHIAGATYFYREDYDRTANND